MSEHDQVPSAISPDDKYLEGRMAHLTGIYRDLADESEGHKFGPDTVEYIQLKSGNIRLCMSELMNLLPVSEIDTHITQTRTNYMDVVLTRPTFRKRHVRKEKLFKTEAAYLQAIDDKIAKAIVSSDPDTALQLGQLPAILERACFHQDQPVEFKDFAANHLFLVIDMALKEHVARRRIINEHATKNVVAKITGNRVLHLCVAGGIIAAALAPDIAPLPTPGEVATHDIQSGLNIISALIVAIDAPEVIRLKYLARRHKEEAANQQEQLAGKKDLTDYSLRMVYGSARYGSSKGYEAVTDRSGTDNKDENLRRFAKVNDQFKNMTNDPGGKPYSGDQALSYAARFILEHAPELQAILEPGKTPDQQTELFLKFSHGILQEDVNRMKKGLTVTKLRKNTMKMVAIVPAALFPSLIAATGDAAGLGSDSVNAISPHLDNGDY
jgi:hypothetical protein